MDKASWRIAWILFAIISSVYFASLAGITSSNDGSHYAFVRALVDKGGIEISEFMSYTEYMDYAILGDLKISDRPPATALFTAPFYLASKFLPPPLFPYRSKHDPQNPGVIFASTMPVLVASLTSVLLFWIVRGHFNLSLWASVITTLAFALGTITWRYGIVLYGHALSGLFVMSAVALILRWGEKSVTWPAHLTLGLILGGSVLAEYPNMVFLILAGLYWAWRAFQHRLTVRTWLRQMAVFTLGGLLIGGLLMLYNTILFGGPFILSAFFVDRSRWPQAQTILTIFGAPLWVGLTATLLYDAAENNNTQGIFWLSPFSLLGLLGLRALWHRSRENFIFVVGSFVGLLLLFGVNATFNSYTNDARYLAPFFGLWFIVVGFGVEMMLQGTRWREALVYGLMFLSIRNQFVHVALSWGHDFKYAELKPLSAGWDNIVLLWRAAFPNMLNIVMWWAALVIAWAIARAVALVKRS